MSGIVIDGVEHAVPGLEVFSWKDDPKIRLGPEDGRPRHTKWIRSVILHTTRGDMPQVVRPYTGPEGLARRTVAAWGNDSRHAGAHLIVDGDGSIWCLADLVRDVTYHATTLNEVSIGIELAQTARTTQGRTEYEIYQSQIDATVKLLDWITMPRFSPDANNPWTMAIQRQFHGPYLGEDHPVARLASGGKDCVGIFGHRDQTEERGPGDPGDAVFHALAAANYEAFDFERLEDVARWSLRQRIANRRGAQLEVDGIPGPAMVGALKKYFKDYPLGVYVRRPGDPTATVA